MKTRDDSLLAFLLLVSVFAIATCGLVYELIAGTLASYLLGDSVTQFSTIIGAYLFAMGIGSWLSRYINRDLLATFVKIELLIGVTGGSAAAILFLIFEHVASFRIPLYGIVGVIGVLVGVEIPLLLRILKDQLDFKDLVSKVFTFDYIGALFASVLFPLLLVPHLGLVRSSFLFGMINVAVALWLLYRFAEEISHAEWHKPIGVAALIFLTMGLLYGQRLMDIAEGSMYQDPIIYSASTPYQRIVITKAPRDLRLFLNNNLQFSSRDEYRYHEALVHTGLAAVPSPKRLLIMGGGDGLAAREALKYASIEDVTLVDLDPAMTRLFTSNELLASLNGHVFESPKMHVVNADAFLWLKDHRDELRERPLDFIIADFPDPSNYSIGKLYTLTFFRLLYDVIAPDGRVVVQSTSPFVAPKAYWCVAKTLRAAGFEVTPYHAYVPSFGEWGFILAGKRTFHPVGSYLDGLKFVTKETVNAMLHFPPDMRERDTEINRLDNQALVRYFDEEWAEYGVY
jgi:spermidine synthase